MKTHRLSRTLFLTVSLLTSVANAALPEPVARWDFEQNGYTALTEGSVPDSQGAHPGTPLGTATTDDTDPVKTGDLYGNPGTGRYLSLDGSGAVHVPWSAALNPYAFTVSAWVKSADTSTWSTVIMSRNSTNFEGFNLYDDDSGKWAFWSGKPNQWEQLVGPNVDRTGWHHLTITYEPTANIGTASMTGVKRLYVDGVEAASISNVPYDPVTTTQSPLGIGADLGSTINDSFTSPLTGAIDELRLYDTAASAADVAYLARLDGNHAGVALPAAMPATVGTGFSYTLPADAFVTFGANQTLTANGLPPGLSFDAATETISGTPTVEGRFNVTLTASSSAGADASQRVAISVASAGAFYRNLKSLHNLPTGRYEIDLGNGPFAVSLDDSEGGNWLLALQYHREVNTSPNRNIIASASDWPLFDDSQMGSDLSASPDRFGHAGNAALDQFGEALEYRWYGQVATYDRTIHFRSTVGDSYARTGLGSFSGIESDRTLLSGHNANLPDSSNNWFSDKGDKALTEFPFYQSLTYHWAIDGDEGGPTPNRWEADTFNDDHSTIHRVWVRLADTSNAAPTHSGSLTAITVDERSPINASLDTSGFSDADGDTLSYFVFGLPTGVAFDPATLAVSGTARSDDIGDNALTVRAVDAWGDWVEVPWTLSITNINDAPTVDQGIADQSAIEDNSFSLSVPADAFSDVDAGDTLSYSVLSGANWLSVSGSNLTGTPLQSDAGTSTVTLRATDNDGLSVDTTFDITVTEINDNAPVFSSAATTSVAESTTTTFYTVETTDIDTDDSVSFAISGTDAALFSIDSVTGQLSFTDAPDFEAPADNGADNVYNVIVTATDAATNQSTLALAVTVSDINDNNPVFSSGASISVNEGTTATGYTAAATDADQADTLSYSISGGVDATHFTVDTSTGVLSFVQASDFESPLDSDADNVYQLVLRVVDAAGNDATLAATVTVVDTFDNAPSFTSANTGELEENSTASAHVASAEDLDAGDSLSFAISGGDDAAHFTIDATTGVITPIAPFDHENPVDTNADNVYALTLSVTDLAGDSTTQPFTLRVTDLNDTAPSFSSAATVSIAEDNYTVGYTALATDPDSADAPALSLRYALTGGADQAKFSIESRTGVLSFITAPDYETPDDADGDSVYDLTITATDTAANSTPLALAITLLDANDNAPALSSAPTALIPEGTTGVFYTATAVDPDNVGTLAFAITGGNDAGLFSIDSASGELSASAVDFEAPGSGSSNNVYNLTLEITDGSNTRDYLLAVTVEDVNDNPPTITSAAALSAPENVLETDYLALATDPDVDDTLAWSLGGGTDDARFSLGASTGVLSFVSAPDAEAPTDSDSDNAYEVIVQATDAANNTATLALTVTVQDVNEAPVVTEQTLSIGEFAAVDDEVGQLNAADPEQDPLLWQLLTESAPFSVSSTGVVNVTGTLDAETKNQYPLSVRVSDGALSTVVALTIDVIDENEAQRLASNVPLSVAQLAAANITGVVEGRENYYNQSIAETDPPPSSMAEIQAIIDRANATANAVERISNPGTAPGSGPTALTDSLIEAGFAGVEPVNAEAYEQAIAAASPAPTTAQEMQQIIDSVNTVLTIVGLAESINANEEGETAALGAYLSTIDGMPAVPEALLPELAAQIERSSPPPQSEAALIALAQRVIDRASTHPVVYLSVTQNGQQIQRVRPNGGNVTLTVQLANPVAGQQLSFDWSASDGSLLALATEANPVTDSLTFDPTTFAPGSTLQAHVLVTRNALEAKAQMRLTAASASAGIADVSDSDGDGVLDAFEGELNASVDASTANKLQTVAGEDTAHVMEADTGVVLRLGSTARAAQANQSVIALEDILAHQPGATSEQVIDALPGYRTDRPVEVFDFEASSLPRAGASAKIVLPLQAPMDENPAYAKYHPATGWVIFHEDGLNRLSSAPAVGGVNGICPPAGHSSYQPGLQAGHACVQLQIEDGGPNDADRLDQDGSASIDAGLNGNIVDPGAIVYVESEALSGPEVVIIGGGSSDGWLLLLMLTLWHRRPLVGNRPEFGRS